MVRGESTREEFAQRIGVHKNTIARWERNEQAPDANEIQLILKNYPKVNPTWFVTGEGDMHRKSRHEASGTDIIEEKGTVYSYNFDAEIEEIVKILRDDLPEAKPYILNVLHGQVEVKKGLEALRFAKWLENITEDKK